MMKFSIPSVSLERLRIDDAGGNVAAALLVCSAANLLVAWWPLPEEAASFVLMLCSISCSLLACLIALSSLELAHRLTTIYTALGQLVSLRNLQPLSDTPAPLGAEMHLIDENYAQLLASLRIVTPYLPDMVLSSLSKADSRSTLRGDWGAEEEEELEELEEEMSNDGQEANPFGFLDDMGSDSSNDILDQTCPQGPVALLEVDALTQSPDSSTSLPNNSANEYASPRSALLRMVGDISFNSPSNRMKNKRRVVRHLGDSSGEDSGSEASTVFTMRSPSHNGAMSPSSGMGRCSSQRSSRSPVHRPHSPQESGVLKAPRKLLPRGALIDHEDGSMTANLLSPQGHRRLPSCRDALVALAKASYRSNMVESGLQSPEEGELECRPRPSSPQFARRMSSRKLLPCKSNLSCMNNTDDLARSMSIIGVRGRRPSCRDALEALKTSSMRNLKETALKVDGPLTVAEQKKRGPRDAMVKRKGTLLSVEFGVLELADDNTHDTYALASSLVSVVLDIVKRESGNVFQLRADGLIASWNTHHACLRHAWSACRAALEIRQAMEAVDDPRDRVGWCVSIASGYLYCGNIGNETQKSPFVLGSVLDDCKRLNELSRVLQTPIIISETVQDLVADQHMRTRPIDVVLFDEEQRTEMVYELLRENDDSDVTLWREAFHDFIEGDYDDSILKFRQMMKVRKVSTSTEMTQQIQEAIGSPKANGACKRRPCNNGFLSVDAGVMDQSSTASTASDFNLEYCQMDRFCQFVETVRANPDIVPRPYARRLLGWEEWSTEKSPLVFESLETQTTSLLVVESPHSADNRPGSARRRKRLPSSVETAPMPAAVRSPVFSSELLKIAIDEASGSPFDAECASSDSCSSSVEDEPPHHFTDAQGSKWKRSTHMIGKGAFGDVWLGMSEEGGLVALKCIHVPQAKGTSIRQSKFGQKNALLEAIQSAITEVKMLSEYKDESIVSFMSCGVYGRYVVITMEYVSGGSLSGVLDQFGTIPLCTAKRYTKDILRGLHYLHSNGIVHRDLKPANVLLHTDGQCKLSDFGTCVDLSSITTTKAEGTPLFMSPEASRGEACKASDMWALGLTVTQMLLGLLPFEYADDVPKAPHAFMRWLCQAEGDVPQPPLTSIGDDAASFVAKVLIRDPTARKSADQLLRDPFVI